MAGAQKPLPIPIPLLTQKEIIEAWSWFVSNMSSRPVNHNSLCIFDLKLWGSNTEPLQPNNQFVAVLGRLYLVAQLGYEDIVFDLVKGDDIQDLIWQFGALDEDIQKVVKSVERFRYHLSEHLAFWVRLAVASQHNSSNFACSRPNIQPEDKGPDGLFVSTGAENIVEIQSVKSSTSNPQNLISTKKFRQGNLSSVKQTKQLEEFYKFSTENFGLVRLDEKLANLLRILNVSANHTIRMGLLGNCSYNAVVVADHHYAKVELFQGYEHVTHEVEHRVATYIGSTEWKQVAEKTRKSVVQTLNKAGFGA